MMEMLKLILVVACCSLLLDRINCNQEVSVKNASETQGLSIEPSAVSDLVMGDVKLINITIHNFHGNSDGVKLPNNFLMRLSVTDSNVATVEELRSVHFSSVNESSWQGSVLLKGVFLGRTSVSFYVCNEEISVENNYTFNMSACQRIKPQLRIAVIRIEGIMDRMFIGVVALIVIVANIAMGCKVELPVVKEVMRRPFAPALGFFCQFVVMPCIALSVLKILAFGGGQAFGYFATGCAPGGGASNTYTYMLGGDVSLSVTMTVVSTLSSVVMMPLWLFTVGQKILDDTIPEAQVTIPFLNIFTSLVGILVPVVIGIIIQYKKPRVANFCVRMIRPIFVFMILFMIFAGFYVHWYLVKLFTPSLILAAILLPYLGFLISGIVALILRQPRPRLTAIIIETGVQNTGIPIVLTLFSLPQPEAALSIVSPVAVALMVPIPMGIAIAVYEVKKRWCNHGKGQVTTGDHDAEKAVENGHSRVTNGAIEMRANGVEDGVTLLPGTPDSDNRQTVTENGNGECAKQLDAEQKYNVA